MDDTCASTSTHETQERGVVVPLFPMVKVDRPDDRPDDHGTLLGEGCVLLAQMRVDVLRRWVSALRRGFPG